MASKNFNHGKRTFWSFFLLSVCLWLISFSIPIFFVDSGDIGTLSLIIEPKEPKAILEITQFLNDGNKFSAFGLIFWNNLKVCIINILGGMFLGIGTFFSLLFNGFYTGSVFAIIHRQGMPWKEIIEYTAPHSIEMIGIWISGGLGFYIALALWNLMMKDKYPRVNFYKVLRIGILISFVLILIAAYIEAYISVP